MLSEMLPQARIGLVHGRMPARDKQKAAEDFRAGEIDVLVATTVIEVGVDAPDATIMVIEHAERFGLAQLHQLRGRVGRGDKPSTCLLLYHGQLGETARARLEIMRSSDDGFVIAEEDWRLRGSGDRWGLNSQACRITESPILPLMPIFWSSPATPPSTKRRARRSLLASAEKPCAPCYTCSNAMRASA